MIEETLYTTLSANSALTTLVSTRIYPVKLPQALTLPAVVYRRIATDPVVSLDGDASALDRVRIQFDSLASTYTVAKDVADKLRDALAGLTPKAVPVFEIDDYDDETQTFRVIADYYVWQ